MLITQRWEREFPAMGTTCHVVVVGGRRELTTTAVAAVARLQELWTRFEPDSEVMRLNRERAGVVSTPTWSLLTRGLVGRRITGGRFDPFMVRQIVAAGYDRDFAALGRQQVDSTAPAVRRPVLRLERRRRHVVLGPGAELDSGGIGKGLAADLVSAELMAGGAQACLVNLGGDLRVRGDKGSPWEIGIDQEGPGDGLSVRLQAGGLATSSRTRRTWQTTSDVVAHHLIDPADRASHADPVGRGHGHRPPGVVGRSAQQGGPAGRPPGGPAHGAPASRWWPAPGRLRRDRDPLAGANS